MENLDLESLEIEKDSFLSNILEDSEGDLIANCKYKNQRALLLFLLEHKSYNDFLVLLQNLGYMVSLWKQKTSKVSGSQKPQDFEVIIPLVFYHGQKDWVVPLEFKDLFHTKDPDLLKYVPNYKYELILIDEKYFETFKQYRELFLLVKTLHYIKMNTISFKYEELILLCINEDGSPNMDLYLTLTIYLMSVATLDWQNYLVSVKIILSQKHEEVTMTLAEKFIQQGEEKSAKQLELMKILLEKERKETQKQKEEIQKQKEEEEKEKENMKSLLKEQILFMAKRHFSYSYDLVDIALKSVGNSYELEKLSLLMFRAKDHDDLEAGLEEIFKK